MARSRGRRYLPATQAVASAQARGETNALAALREYRAEGGSIRTQQWYRLWRGQQAADVTGGVPGTPPTLGVQPGRRPIDWVTNVQVVYWDPGGRKTQQAERFQTFWFPIYSGGPRRISDERALREAMDAGVTGRGGQDIENVARTYGWVPIYAHVASYEPRY